MSCESLITMVPSMSRVTPGVTCFEGSACMKTNADTYTVVSVPAGLHVTVSGLDRITVAAGPGDVALIAVTDATLSSNACTEVDPVTLNRNQPRRSRSCATPVGC